MKLTGDNWSTGRKPCPSATLFTTNPTWNGLNLSYFHFVYNKYHMV